LHHVHPHQIQVVTLQVGKFLGFHSGAFENSDLLTCDTTSLSKCFTFIFRTYCTSNVSHPKHQTQSSQFMCTMTV